jgi:glucosamine-6-phosphate deaminase
MGDRSYPEKTYTVDRLSVQIYASEWELATDAAAIAGNHLRSLLQQREIATVILATGNSQILFLQALITLEGIDWSRVGFFHLDEYLGIEADHPASFRRYLRERVENFVQPAWFQYIEGDAVQPLDECDRYGQLLNARAIDLCCLGVGENGHLAFNEPSVADFQDPRSVKLVKLDQANREQQVRGGHFPDLAAVPRYAFTLTIPAIRRAEKILCLAPGTRKTQVMETMLRGEVSPACPASILRETPRSILFLDRDSAGEAFRIS